jgi:GDP-L-fucose synthase
MEPKDTKVVVTGGKGFLGRFVTQELNKLKFGKVYSIGSKDYDLVHSHEVEKMFAQLSPTHIIHLAAAVGGIGSNVENPGYFSYANTMMGANIIECSRKYGVEKVVVIGTICVYPHDAPVPTSESQIFEGYPADDTAPYGIAKRNLWSMGAAYREQYGMNVIYLIPTNLYGPYDHFSNERSHVIPALIKRIVSAKMNGAGEINVWGSGSNTREFLHVEDAAKGIVKAFVEYNSSSPLNLGSGIETSIKELVELIVEKVDYKGKVNWDSSKPSGAMRRSLDVSAIRREIGFSANIKLTDGLNSTVDWYLKSAKRVKER